MKVSYTLTKLPMVTGCSHTTLQLITKQGCKSLPVKVNPEAEANIIPLSRYRSLFPHHFHTSSTLRANSFRKSKATWSPHDGTTHKFIGFFMVDVQHKTRPYVIPISFYVFKDSTRPSTLLSYAASIHLCILEFKVPIEARSYNINAISKRRVSHLTHLYVAVDQLKLPQAVREAKVSPEAKHYFPGPSVTTGTTLTRPFPIVSRPFCIISGPFCFLPRLFLCQNSHRKQWFLRPCFCKRCARCNFFKKSIPPVI